MRRFAARPGGQRTCGRGYLNARDVRHEPAAHLDVRVPLLVPAVELVELMAALGEPDRLRRVGRDAVLVPGDVPGDRDHKLRIDAGEGDDRRLRLTEALGDAADRAAELAAVEQVGGLDHSELLVGEAT